MANVSCVELSTPTYTLVIELNEKEAIALKSMVQNPICQDEPTIDAHIRQQIFNKLNEVI